jgi:hypothetical protein
MAGLKTGKNAARLGLVLSELRARTELVLHHDLLLNFMAVQLVRPGEDPIKFEATLHKEKVEALREEAERAGPAFFLPLPELKILRETWKMSSEGWLKFWRASQAQAERLAHVLKIASSTDVYKTSDRTTTPA